MSHTEMVKMARPTLRLRSEPPPRPPETYRLHMNPKVSNPKPESPVVGFMPFGRRRQKEQKKKKTAKVEEDKRPLGTTAQSLIEAAIELKWLLGTSRRRLANLCQEEKVCRGHQIIWFSIRANAMWLEFLRFCAAMN